MDAYYFVNNSVENEPILMCGILRKFYVPKGYNFAHLAYRMYPLYFEKFISYFFSNKSSGAFAAATEQVLGT